MGGAITARLERPLLAIARGAIGKRPVAARLEAALATAFTAAIVALGAGTVAEIAARGIALLAAAERAAVAIPTGRAAITVAAGGTLVAVVLAGEAALGELLVRSPGLARTALGRAAVTPVAGIVVFVAVARHE